MSKPPISRTSMWITLAVAVPVAYVISILPVALLMDRMGMTTPPKWLETFYKPVELLIKHCEPLAEVLQFLFEWLKNLGGPTP